MAKLPESKERRLQGLNQDVLAVATPVPGPDLEPVKLRPQKKNKPVSVSEGGHSGLLWLSLVLAVIALLLAASQWLANSATSRELSELRQQYYQLASERQSAEARSTAKASSSAVSEVSAPGNNVALTNLRDDVRELNAKVRGLTVAMAKQRNNDQESAELAARLNDMDSRLKGLSSRISSLADRPQPAAAPVVQPASNSAELSALAGKVAKIDKDLQALYRILQGG